MPLYTPVDDSPELSPAAQKEWSGHVEAVLRGVSHALNNRSAALSALIQLADDQESPSTLRSILATELDRVTALAAAISAIGTPRAGEEAFSPADAAAEALEVLGLHSDQRDHSTRIEVRDAAPVRARRWMFVRALIVLAANVGKARPDALLEISSDGDDLLVQAQGASPGASPFVQEVARAMGGDVIDAGRGFRMPTLSAVRRREGS